MSSSSQLQAKFITVNRTKTKLSKTKTQAKYNFHVFTKFVMIHQTKPPKLTMSLNLQKHIKENQTKQSYFPIEHKTKTKSALKQIKQN